MKRKIWTQAEIELLTEMSSKYSRQTIAEKLGRSVQQVNKKAHSLGISLISEKFVWSEEKIKFLKENINRMPLSKISKELNISYYQIMVEVKKLGLTYQSNRWTEEEEKILTELSSKCFIKDIAKVLGRSEGSIISKAKQMGLDYVTLTKKYTQEELDYIKNNWGIVPVNEMARTLKVSRNMIQTQADSMNLPKLGSDSYSKWTEEAIKKLRRLAKTKTITELAYYFKTTNSAISSVASRNQISLIDEKNSWTEADNLLLKECAKTMNLAQIAIQMEKSTSAIRLHAKREGIEIRKNEQHQKSVWTDQDSEELQKLIQEEKTLLQIAATMGKKDAILLKKAREMGLKITREKPKSWSQEDKQKLISLSQTKTLSELVCELQRTSASIKQQAKNLGISIMPDRKNWTTEELELLKRLVMVEQKSVKEIAMELGRTEDAITIKMNHLGLRNAMREKRFWTSEEEIMLSDLWGIEPIETIAKKLNRTVSSVQNKSFQLNLGSQIESNYDGLKIMDICELFQVGYSTVSVYWVALGLAVKTRKVTKVTSYHYVEIKDLYQFLEKNQNIWDSRVLERNILGVEPSWLQEKRKSDRLMPIGYFGIENLTKQQLLQTKKYLMSINSEEKEIIHEEQQPVLSHKLVKKK